MSTTKRSGGLGRKIFTTPTEGAAASDDVQRDAPVTKTKASKIRTTVTLYPQTLAAMEQLKVELRKSGDKATLSDVLEQAVAALMDKKGIKL